MLIAPQKIYFSEKVVMVRKLK
jgi:hypothetical protein